MQVAQTDGFEKNNNKKSIKSNVYVEIEPKVEPRWKFVDAQKGPLAKSPQINTDRKLPYTYFYTAF